MDSRSGRAFLNAAIAVGVFLAYVAACMIAIDGVALNEVSPGQLDGLPTLLIALLWGAGWVFLGSFVFDGLTAKLSGSLRRLVVVLVLICGAVAFAFWFNSILAADDDRDVFGWLAIPAALLFGLVARLPPRK